MKLFIGTVIDNNDPMKLQRVRVSCPDMFDNIPTDGLPWFMSIQSTVQGNRPGMGSLSPLAVGSRVWVSFLDETPYHPVIWGAATTGDTKLSELTGADYPHCYGHVDQSGNIFLTNTAQNTITVGHVSGTSVNINGAGKITIVTASDVEVHTNGDTVLRTSGDTHIHSGGGTNIFSTGPINLNGSSVNINGGGGAIAPNVAVARSRPA